MLQIIYGVPGSGKSYYAVFNIKKTIEKAKDNVVIVSNIENLKLPHLDLDSLVNQYGGIDAFFNADCSFWKQDIEKKKILFIDEAQKYFNKRFFSSNVFFFFQYHRHLNVDIYLITQSYKVLPSELVVLSEIVIQAVPSSFRFFKSSFRYLVKDLETFETLERIDIPFKKEVANLYTSALVIQDNKKMTYTQKYIIFSVLIIAVALVVLIFVFPKLLFSNLSLSKSSQKSNQNNVSIQKSNQNNVSIQSVNLPSFDGGDGFEYPHGITTKGYRRKEISYGEFLNRYRNGVVYDLSVNYVAVYDRSGRVKTVYIYKEDSQNQDNQDNQENQKSDNLQQD